MVTDYFEALITDAIKDEKIQLCINLNLDDFVKRVDLKTAGLLNQVLGCLTQPDLDDFECIEKMLDYFEAYGIDTSPRHDFG